MTDASAPYVPTDQEVLDGRYKGDEIPSGTLPGAKKALGLAAVLFLLLMALAAFKNRDPERTTEDFFLRKLHQPAIYDAVLIGDSRVVQGIDPTAMGGKAFNFGFEGLGLTPDVIHAAAKLLRPDGPKILAVAFSAPALSQDSQASNGFTEVFHLNPVQQFNLKTFGPAERYLTSKRTAYAYRTRRNDLGFAGVETDRDLTGEREKAYDKPGYPMYDPKILQTTLGELEKLSKEGVQVVGFRVPTSQKMYFLERDLSKVPTDLPAQLAEIGGRWIPGPQRKFVSRDGSHLTYAEAQDYSRWLGEKLGL
ncbi:hypothetical protein EON81_02475 [bacterium]|nr:MAG: hypothetical protein EON81_02475 [bacterium]